MVPLPPGSGRRVVDQFTASGPAMNGTAYGTTAVFSKLGGFSCAFSPP